MLNTKHIQWNKAKCEIKIQIKIKEFCKEFYTYIEKNLLYNKLRVRILKNYSMYPELHQRSNCNIINSCYKKEKYHFLIQIQLEITTASLKYESDRARKEKAELLK